MCKKKKKKKVDDVLVYFKCKLPMRQMVKMKNKLHLVCNWKVMMVDYAATHDHLRDAWVAATT